jgi:hypothetical protein
MRTDDANNAAENTARRVQSIVSNEAPNQLQQRRIDTTNDPQEQQKTFADTTSMRIEVSPNSTIDDWHTRLMIQKAMERAIYAKEAHYE